MQWTLNNIKLKVTCLFLIRFNIPNKHIIVMPGGYFITNTYSIGYERPHLFIQHSSRYIKMSGSLMIMKNNLSNDDIVLVT